MNQTTFVSKVYEVVSSYNPDIDETALFQELLIELETMKDKALRMDIITSSFKPEPELFPVRQTLADARARQAEQRQGEL